MSQPRSALILGATGAVGKALLRDLLKARAFERVVSIGRREIDVSGLEGSDMLIQKVVDFEKLEESTTEFRGFSHAFCCLGTTRAAAGSDEAFFRIDHDYVINSAKLIAEQNPMSPLPKEDGKAASPVHFLYCSSVHADPSSRFLYLRTKGLIEKDLSSLRFSRLTIFQPAFLDEAQRDKPRALENLNAKLLMPLVNFLQPKKHSIPVTTLARSMRLCAVPNGSAAVDESKDNNDQRECVVERLNNVQCHEIGANEV